MDFISRMVLSELYRIMVKNVTFVGFREAIAPIASLWIRPWANETSTLYAQNLKYKHKNSVFTLNIQPTKIHVFHFFIEPKFASSKKN